MTQPFCIYCNRFVDTWKNYSEDKTGKTIVTDTGNCSICMNPTQQRDMPKVGNTV